MPALSTTSRASLLLASIALATLSAANPGLTLSGGSIPTGGPKPIQGLAILPFGPDAGATVTVSVLETGEVLAVTTTDSTGAFSTGSIPRQSDIEIEVTSPGVPDLTAIVSVETLNAGVGTGPGTGTASSSGADASSPANSGSQTGTAPVNIGIIDATSTVIDTALRLEIGAAPQSTRDIVSSQFSTVSTAVTQQQQSATTQQMEISNPISLVGEASLVVTSTENLELQSLAAADNEGNARTALNGLVGYLHAVYGSGLVLNSTQQKQLEVAQVRGSTFTAAEVADALQDAKIPGVSVDSVNAASATVRATLPALALFGPDLSAYEATLVIASQTDPLSGAPLDTAAVGRALKRLLHSDAGGG